MMMKHVMHPYHAPHGHRDVGVTDRGQRESMLDAVGWAALFFWVGVAWLLGTAFGYILVGIGVVMLVAQGLRWYFSVKIKAFWLLVGCGFFVAGYWELWNVGIPLAPIILIVAGVGLLASQFVGHNKHD